MDREFETTYHALERSHWWFVARRDILLRLIRRDGHEASTRILEIGCSSGALLEDLREAGFSNLTGLDLSEVAVNACRNRGLESVMVGDGADPHLPHEAFDVIIASDVLEHIEEDDRALVAWRRLLTPEGRLYLFVPAHPWLWSRHDEANHHWRRYSRRNLSQRLRESGFEIEQLDGWNATLLAPVAAVRFAQRIARSTGLGAGRHQLGATPAIVNRLLLAILRLENLWLAARGRLPMGISLFAVARRNRDASTQCAPAEEPAVIAGGAAL